MCTHFLKISYHVFPVNQKWINRVINKIEFKKNLFSVACLCKFKYVYWSVKSQQMLLADD